MSEAIKSEESPTTSRKEVLIRRILTEQQLQQKQQKTSTGSASRYPVVKHRPSYGGGSTVSVEMKRAHTVGHIPNKKSRSSTNNSQSNGHPSPSPRQPSQASSSSPHAAGELEHLRVQTKTLSQQIPVRSETEERRIRQERLKADLQRAKEASEKRNPSSSAAVVVKKPKQQKGVSLRSEDHERLAYEDDNGIRTLLGPHGPSHAQPLPRPLHRGSRSPQYLQRPPNSLPRRQVSASRSNDEDEGWTFLRDQVVPYSSVYPHELVVHRPQTSNQVYSIEPCYEEEEAEEEEEFKGKEMQHNEELGVRKANKQSSSIANSGVSVAPLKKAYPKSAGNLYATTEAFRRKAAVTSSAISRAEAPTPQATASNNDRSSKSNYQRAEDRDTFYEMKPPSHQVLPSSTFVFTGQNATSQLIEQKQLELVDSRRKFDGEKGRDYGTMLSPNPDAAIEEEMQLVHARMRYLRSRYGDDVFDKATGSSRHDMAFSSSILPFSQQQHISSRLFHDCLGRKLQRLECFMLIPSRTPSPLEEEEEQEAPILPSHSSSPILERESQTKMTMTDGNMETNTMNNGNSNTSYNSSYVLAQATATSSAMKKEIDVKSPRSPRKASIVEPPAAMTSPRPLSPTLSSSGPSSPEISLSAKKKRSGLAYVNSMRNPINSFVSKNDLSPEVLVMHENNNYESESSEEESTSSEENGVRRKSKATTKKRKERQETRKGKANTTETRAHQQQHKFVRSKQQIIQSKRQEESREDDEFMDAEDDKKEHQENEEKHANFQQTPPASVLTESKKGVEDHVADSPKKIPMQNFITQEQEKVKGMGGEFHLGDNISTTTFSEEQDETGNKNTASKSSSNNIISTEMKKNNSSQKLSMIQNDGPQQTHGNLSVPSIGNIEGVHRAATTSTSTLMSNKSAAKEKGEQNNSLSVTTEPQRAKTFHNTTKKEQQSPTKKNILKRKERNESTQHQQFSSEKPVISVIPQEDIPGEAKPYPDDYLQDSVQELQETLSPSAAASNVHHLEVGGGGAAIIHYDQDESSVLSPTHHTRMQLQEMMGGSKILGGSELSSARSSEVDCAAEKQQSNTANVKQQQQESSAAPPNNALSPKIKVTSSDDDSLEQNDADDEEKDMESPNFLEPQDSFKYQSFMYGKHKGHYHNEAIAVKERKQQEDHIEKEKKQKLLRKKLSVTELEKLAGIERFASSASLTAIEKPPLSGSQESPTGASTHRLSSFIAFDSPSNKNATTKSPAVVKEENKMQAASILKSTAVVVNPPTSQHRNVSQEESDDDDDDEFHDVESNEAEVLQQEEKVQQQNSPSSILQPQQQIRREEEGDDQKKITVTSPKVTFLPEKKESVEEEKGEGVQEDLVSDIDDKDIWDEEDLDEELQYMDVVIPPEIEPWYKALPEDGKLEVRRRLSFVAMQSFRKDGSGSPTHSPNMMRRKSKSNVGKNVG